MWSQPFRAQEFIQLHNWRHANYSLNNTCCYRIPWQTERRCRTASYRGVGQLFELNWTDGFYLNATFLKGIWAQHSDTRIKFKFRPVETNFSQNERMDRATSSRAEGWDNLQSAVRHNGKLGEFFPVERGVAQGCILSPLLFAIYLDDRLVSLRAERFNNGIITN
jgi:hypothetical protein